MPSTVMTAHGTRDELAVPARRGPGRLPGGIRGFLWPTEFLMFSGTLVAAPHQHSALQLTVGLDGMPRVRLDGTWQYTPGVLIDTDVAHALHCDGSLTAIGWIEGESRIGQHLRERVLAGRPYAVLDEALSARLAETLRLVLAAEASCDDAHAWWRRALGELAPGITAEAEPDRRIAAGFADSAHLTRTAVRMNGGAPTEMRFSRWLSNCR